MMDQNKPARFLDTAYNALKANPGATNQILQAAAQGQPVGLRGLAAAAAQQSQQEAQKAMTALQQQGPQPNIIQKMATQGIMSQMDTGLPMAPQMGAPEEMPQQMAGGGLVSFADGGNVLPPDVIEAIQSHFADGGEVRGFAEGDIVDLLRQGLTREEAGSSGIDEALRRTMGWGMDKEAAEEELRRLGEKISGQRIPMGMEEAAGYDPKRLTLRGPERGSLSEENKRLDELIRRQRAAQPMLEGLSKSANTVNPYTYAGEIHNLPETPYTYESGQANMPRTPLEHKTLSPEAQAFQSEQLSNAERLANAGERPPAEPSLRERLNASAGRAGQPFSLSGVSDTVGPMAKKALKTLMGTAGALGSVYETGKTGKELYDIYQDPTMGTQEKAEKGLSSALRSGLGAVGSSIGGIYGGVPGAMAGGAGGAGLADTVLGLGERLAGITPESMEASKYGDVNRAITLDELKARQIASGFIPELGTSRYPEEEEESEEYADESVLKEPKAKIPVKGAPSAPPPKTWKPEPHDGAEVTPRQRVIEEGTKLDKPFKEAKTDVPSAAVTPDSQNLGGLTALGGLGNMEQMRDLIMSLGGHKEMRPEILQKLGDLEGSARTSTILQSALGALGAGLSDPYGGRYALGRAALGALSGYQSGIKSEEDIGRKAFDVLRGYADAPEEEKTAARDKLFDIAKKSAELQSEERRSALRGVGGLSFEERMLLKQAGDPRKGLLTQGDIANAKAQALKMTEDWAKTQAANPPFTVPTDAEKMNKTREFMLQILPATDERTIGGLGANIGAAQSSGLGGGTPRIYQ